MDKNRFLWVLLIMVGVVMLAAVAIFGMIGMRHAQDMLDSSGDINLTDKCGVYNGIYFAVEVSNIFCNPTKATLHEYAHYLERSLPDSKVSEWESIHNTTTHFVSNYAKKTEGEDFADTFAYVTDICIHRDKLDDLTPEQHQFFFDNVVGRFPYCEG